MDVYSAYNAAEFDFRLFEQPPAAFRGAPFWSWNTKLKREQLLKQIETFKQMGLGGFHIHVRTGLDTEYLGAEYLELVRACVEKAREEGLFAWLYDEDRWPSGAAGGLVTVEPRFRAKHLLFTRVPYEESISTIAFKLDSSARTGRTGNGTLLARYEIHLREGALAEYRRLRDDERPQANAQVWYAYLETALNSPWFNNQTYVDTLQKEAIQRFLEVTHERYAQNVGEYLGSTIPAIFTDEPQFAHKSSLRFAEEQRDLILPWTTDLLSSYEQAYGQHLEDALPELFWELPAGVPSLTRYRYHDHISERFSSAFADTIGTWCRAHGLALTGHMMEEPTLTSQTQALGEAMRSYRSFELPGIDMLCDRHEYTTAKQAQSAAHQYGRPGVLSELYGVTNWDFPFVGHKAQGDWQAALGVTVRVHHLTWVSMAGEAKRDYPASIGYQSPWYREYPLIEDHFARVNAALTRGRALVRVGVIHPIESFWLCFGPQEQTAGEREEREQAFADLTHWLLFGLTDFDFIAESLLPTQSLEQTGSQFQVGESRYDVVIVPGMRTIRSSTLARLQAFHEVGGTIIFAGEGPSLVDARPSEEAHQLAMRCIQIPLTRRCVLEALEPFREVEARQADGRMAETLLHQVRADGEQRFIFFCNTDREQGYPQVTLRFKGSWHVTVLDTLTGQHYPLQAQAAGEETLVRWSFPAHGSLLLRLEPGWREEGIPQPLKTWHALEDCPSPVPVTLSEPNVLLLDQARYRLDDEPWQSTEEILRIDNLLRQRLGYPLKMEAFTQPWTERERPPATHRVSLAFTVEARVAVQAPQLALEDAAKASITFNGQRVSGELQGWFVDEAIQTVQLPDLNAGTHELIIEWPYDRLSNLEWCYLLGDFGVVVQGRRAILIEPVRELAFGDWTYQGLPFYAGNVTYHCTIEGREQEMAVRVPQFKAPLLSVSLDGQPRERIAFAPFESELGFVQSGQHRLDLTAFGNRVNAFGCVHNADRRLTWYGPEAWRSTGDAWAYEYQLKPMGILIAPRLLIETLA